MQSKRKRYRLDGLLAEMPERLPRVEGWDEMGEVGAEVLDDAGRTTENSSAVRSPVAERVLDKAVTRAAGLLGVPDEVLADAVGDDLRGRGVLFVRLFVALDGIAGGTAPAWMRCVNSELGGQPIEVIRTPEGLAEVVRFVESRRDGEW